MAFQNVNDPRNPRGRRFPAAAMLATATAATLAGARSFRAIADWVASRQPAELLRLGFYRATPPRETAIRRFLQRLDSTALNAETSSFLRSKNTSRAASAIAVDGKALRRAKDAIQGAPVLLSAVTHGDGITIAQCSVSPAIGEMKTVRQLLETLDIAGMVVTFDALHTQQDTARFIVEEKRADYVMIVKANQPNLKRAIEEHLTLAFSPAVS